MNFSLSRYPLDSVDIRQRSQTLGALNQKIDGRVYLLSGRHTKCEVGQSAFIEAVLMRVPVTPVFRIEDMQGKVTFATGLKALIAYRLFLLNVLELDLPHRAELHGLLFKDLEPRLQNRFEDCWVTVNVLGAMMPKQVQLDIIARVKSFGQGSDPESYS